MMFPRRRGRGEGPLACLMTKHFDLKFAASMKLVKARAWRLPVVPPGTSPIGRQPAAINPRPGYHGLSRAGPKFRIHLPPAASLSLHSAPGLKAKRPALSREDRRVPEMRLIDSLAALAVDQTAQSFRMISAARSPMMTQGAIVLPVVTFGMIEPSAMRSPSMP
jgi:hypothetical protein